MRGGLLIVMALGAVAVAAPAPKSVSGNGFSFPIPDGYEDVSAALAGGNAGDLVGAAAKKHAAGKEPATIVVQPANVAAKTRDPRACQAIAEAMADGVHGKLERAEIIAGPLGPACQMRIVARLQREKNDAGLEEAIITEISSEQKTWLMTCNHDAGDAAAAKVCGRAVAGFRLG
jgi:hypothetical protein